MVFTLMAAMGPAGDAAAGVGAAIAVLLLIGGPLLLRAQRQRHQFQLARLAIERGAVQVPLESPLWLQSMRAGVLTLTFSIALLLVGSAACWLGSGATMPANTTHPADVPQLAIPGFPPPRPPRPDPVEERWHEARAERGIGLTAIGCGVILSMLGVARLSFARIERRHDLQTTSELVSSRP